MLTREELAKLLDYNPETGLFTAVCTRSRRRQGDLATPMCTKGYVRICVQGRRYFAHRLAWLCMTGSWPVAQIDHINGIRTDNRFVNLREATATQNRVNTRRKYKSSSGVRGVYWHKKLRKWQVEITAHRKPHYYGRFDTLEEAAAVAASARKSLFGEFCPEALSKCSASA